MRNIEGRKTGILNPLFYFNYLHFNKINGLSQKTFLFFSNKIEAFLFQGETKPITF